MGINYNPSIVIDSSLVLHLDAANTRSYPGSGTSWTDLSGNGNTGTLANGPTYNPLNGGSLVFDGTDDYVTVSNNISPGTGDFAISVFVYKTDTYPNRYVWDLGTNGAVLSTGTSITPGFRYYNPTVGYIFGPTHTVNTWYNIVISRISGTTYFYSNGSLVNSAADTGNIGSWGTTLNIGRYGGGGSIHLGKISNLSVYKGRGLTAAEVLQNYNALIGRYNTNFNPLSISGIQFWVDASDSTTLYQDSGLTTLAVANNDVVGGWKDKSGNNRHATQSSSAAKPLLKTAAQNSRNVVSLDGINDLLNISGVSPTFSGYTCFCAFTRPTTGIISKPLGGDNSAGGYTYPFHWYTNDGIYIQTSSGFYNIGSSSIGAQQITVSHVSSASSTLNLRKNGVLLDSRSYSGTTNFLTYIGYNSVEYHNGNIFEILVYDSELSASNILLVEAYLKDKWGTP